MNGEGSEAGWDAGMDGEAELAGGDEETGMDGSDSDSIDFDFAFDDAETVADNDPMIDAFADMHDLLGSVSPPPVLEHDDDPFRDDDTDDEAVEWAHDVHDRLIALRHDVSEAGQSALARFARNLRMTYEWVTSDWSQRPLTDALPPGIRQLDQGVQWLSGDTRAPRAHPHGDQRTPEGRVCPTCGRRT